MNEKINVTLHYRGKAEMQAINKDIDVVFYNFGFWDLESSTNH